MDTITKCPECREEFLSILDVENHFLSEHEEDGQNIKHQKSISPKKPKYKSLKYQCHQCDKEYIHEGHFIAHVKATHKVVNYSCKQCEYNTSHESKSKKSYQVKTS